MASTEEHKKEGGCGRGGGHKWGPKSEEERQKHEAEFKQFFDDEYRKRYNDSTISAEQTWELFVGIKDQWRAKKREQWKGKHEGHEQGKHEGHGKGSGSRSPSHSPSRWEEKRKQMQTELHTEFEKDYTTAHGNNKINADQAWALVQQVKKNKREKFGQGHGHGGHGHHGHGHGHGHGRSSPPKDQ
ncbi:unnamed protein product [Adineta steineri]|uniref:Uncharacterized protein n=1 Tax=Adineta steineri TaxID=433720 RepID=A0A818XKI2_9BILA|nr:unnamed protein product [Adineta steineri]CAF3741919.1 unnamed protein product [Adineta steineri]